MTCLYFLVGWQSPTMILLTLNFLCVYSGTYGVVDYTNPEDMKYAVSVLKISSSFF